MIPIGSHPVWHPVFETLAYAAGYAVFRHLRTNQGDVVAEPQRWTVLAAAAVGALIGARLLGLAEQWPTVLQAWHQGRILALLLSPGGKTIVGGLLGGWLGVEIIKRLSNIHRRTGDLFALPLCVGIAIGRIGCLIAGLADDTYGNPTSPGPSTSATASAAIPSKSTRSFSSPPWDSPSAPASISPKARASASFSPVIWPGVS